MSKKLPSDLSDRTEKEIIEAIGAVKDDFAAAQDPPEVVPQATQILSINATVFSIGRGAVSLRSPDPTVFESPDAAIVITGLTTNMLRQFAVGQVYSIAVSTSP